MLLEVIDVLKERCKAEHVANVLYGKSNAEISTFKHDKLEIFGIGDAQPIKFWKALIRQALVAQLLEKEIVNYGLLKITKAGRAYMKNPRSFMMTKDHDYDDNDEKSENITGGTAAADTVLFSLLKDLRKAMAKQLNLPPFVIFSDPSLQDMAIQYPITMDELTKISGVGVGKAQKYGKQFIELIHKHVVENEIERPQDMIVKSVVNKSGNKVYIIKSIDLKMPLDDIAEAKGLEMIELIHEIEAIVNAGTKLNIDYYLYSIMDQEHIDDIYNYFRDEADTESIEDALKELGENEYSEEEVRLVRVKFIAEMGN